MKYFTKELWLGYNSRNDAVNRNAIEQGEFNYHEYVRQLEELRPRLSENTHRFFTTENLHDGRLLAFTTGDGIDFNTHGSEKFDINARKTSVQMKVLGASLDMLFTLNYTKVKRIVFDYPTDEPLFHKEGWHIGDWGYDELTAADDKYLRHEVLFASGTTILIEFKDFSYEKEACEGTRYI
jgi:hypothetical protein